MQKVKQFNLEIQAWEEKEAKPQTALSLLQAIYLDEVQPLPVRICCAAEALPYENPKLSAVAVGYMSADSFAARGPSDCQEREGAGHDRGQSN